MQLAAQVPQPQSWIVLRPRNARQRRFQRRVGVIKPLEFLQLRYQCAPFALGNAQLKKDQEGVKAGFFHHQSALCEKAGDDRRGNTATGQTSMFFDAGRQ